MQHLCAPIVKSISVTLITIAMCALSPGSIRAAEQLAIVSISNDQKIAVYSINEAGSLMLKSSVETAGKPGAMCVDHDGMRLYVVMKSTGSIAAYRIEGNCELSLLNETIVGDDASYLSLHPSGEHLLSSYYAAGKVAVHRLDDEGRLSAQPLQTVATDEKAHAIVFGPSGKFAFVPHTRPNTIFQFVFDAQTGKLTSNEPAKLLRDADTGPRHLWFHPTGSFAYGSDEQGNSVTAYRLDDSTGSLELIQTVSSLPADGFSGRNSTSDIEVHPSGKFVYIANRGHNTIAGYSVNTETGQLSLLQHTPTEAVTRSFNIAPDGQYLVAAGQSSGKLAVFRIDEKGLLRRVSTNDAGPGPWWVQIIQRPASKSKIIPQSTLETQQ